MSRPVRWVVALVGAVLALAPALGAQVRFPHERHEGLFPVCSGCHEGIESGATEAVYPSPQVCAMCHDGRIMPPVAWLPPRPRASNLRFVHTVHREKAAAQGESPECQTCHGLPGRTGPMAVGAPVQANCSGCHAHEAPEHVVAEARCTLCHLPLAEATRLDAERIAKLPRPAFHQPADFLLRHRPTPERVETQCAVCHTRESCTRCHMNAGSIPVIQALAPDPRVAALVGGRAPAYPLPPDHRDRRWSVKHGGVAGTSIARCANCHARQGCESCHRDVGARSPIAKLPTPPQEDQRGVRLAERRVPGHVPGFEAAHGGAAAADQPRCSICHTEQTCTACHDRATAPRFHPSNFLARHGPEAFGRMSDCASCHSTEAFCRACHVSSGIQAAGREDAPFHDAEPLWLLGHGQAARQGLESCVSCHTQADCLRCHSTTVGWGVNPHGPGFDPSRVAERNRLTCRRCHIGDPLKRP
ncbi:MAG: hypothetical protein HY704_08760 [Gemmatimonadetes bacterium]|nr:hypothetical protein [Gemmatimonadota bacterium]